MVKVHRIRESPSFPKKSIVYTRPQMKVKESGLKESRLQDVTNALSVSLVESGPNFTIFLIH